MQPTKTQNNTEFDILKKCPEQTKIRTPSGSTINVKIGDIRAIFSPDRYKACEKSDAKDIKGKITQPLRQRLRSTRISEFETKTSVVVRTSKNRTSHQRNVNKHQLFEDEKLSSQQTRHKRGCSESDTKDYFTPPGTPKVQQALKRSKGTPVRHSHYNLRNTPHKSQEIVKMQQSGQEPEAAHISQEVDNMETSDSEQIKTMNIEMVMGMFKRLENRLDQIEEKFPGSEVNKTSQDLKLQAESLDIYRQKSRKV